MKRRKFIQSLPMTALPVALTGGSALAQDAAAKAAPAAKTAAKTTGGKVPDFAGYMLDSDMQGLGPDGKATGMKATFTGASQANTTAESAAKHKMTLTKEEQATLDGKDGPEMAKLMKIQVLFGNTFGADKLVDLGGAPHSNLYPGAPYLGSMIKMLDECAKAGLKSYAPYTVNPRPYDCFNVQNTPEEMKIVYEGYPLQKELDWVHARLGAPDLNKRSCACYVKEVGNAPKPGTYAPKPGTYVAWAESSAVNYGNSALGIRTNRNGAGIDLICAMTGKAPHFGLMTDEGRMAKWMVDVKTSKTPDWGVLGTAIGRKVVEDVPYVVGIDQYFEGGEITEDNLHLLKAMGSATAASGAVGLYHVDNLTPDAKEKGRKLLAEGYQTYVYDDAEEQKIIATFQNMWPEKEGDPTAAFIGCPHNTYFELVKWGKLVIEGLEKAGKEKAAIPVYMFCANVVRNRLIAENGELAGKMMSAGMISTPMCGVTWAGTKGFSERVQGVTNSAKTRNYSSIRYFPDQTLVDIMVTGKVPS
jgi:predicted aconitase